MLTDPSSELSSAAKPTCGRPVVLVTGATGLVGSLLSPVLAARGWIERRLVRGEARAGGVEFRWDPLRGAVDRAAFSGVDAVVHLAGENVAAGRWTAERKRRIRDSRLLGTRTLVDAVAALPAPKRPRVFVSASATGYYGEVRDRTADESAPPGRDFLAQVCHDWEAEARRAESLGLRVVLMRTGIVLTRKGGALAKMLPAFRLGLGVRLGDGRHWMSWIAGDDLAAVYLRALEDSSWRGPINATAPEPVTNAAFTRTLARVLHRPNLFGLPRPVLRLVLGELSDGALLVSSRVVPARLRAAGFVWSSPDLYQTVQNAVR